MPLKKSVAKGFQQSGKKNIEKRWDKKKPATKKKEIGINNIEIECKWIEEIRTIQQLREHIVNQIGIYESLLKIIDKEFDYEKVYDRSSDTDKFDILLRAARKLG